MLKACRLRFDYLSQNKSNNYLMFLKKNLLANDPYYYGVAAARLVDTREGPMYAIRIIEDIENPEFEPIAECTLNGRFYYLWRDRCWAIANNFSNCPILQYNNLQQS